MICARTQGTGQPLFGPRAWGKLLFSFLIRKPSRYNSSRLVGIFVNSMSQSLNCGSRGVMSVEHCEESDNTGLEHARTQNSKPKVTAVSEVFMAAHRPRFTVHRAQISVLACEGELTETSRGSLCIFTEKSKYQMEEKACVFAGTTLAAYPRGKQ